MVAVRPLHHLTKDSLALSKLLRNHDESKLSEPLLGSLQVRPCKHSGIFYVNTQNMTKEPVVRETGGGEIFPRVWCHRLIPHFGEDRTLINLPINSKHPGDWMPENGDIRNLCRVLRH